VVQRWESNGSDKEENNRENSPDALSHVSKIENLQEGTVNKRKLNELKLAPSLAMAAAQRTRTRGWISEDSKKTAKAAKSSRGFERTQECK
jgi:hypothetical protein